MSVSITKEQVFAIHANARIERGSSRTSRLWPSMIAAWTRHLDRRIEHDLRRLDHAGVQEDFRRASHG